MIKDEVLAKEWIPVANVKEIQEEPVQVTVLGERVVLFRTSKGIKALKDLCIHRGANLSIGKIKNDCIQCAYHGWEYNGDGDCTKIPQLTERQAIPLKAKAIPYACMEKYGLVWVNLAGNDPEPPVFGKLDDPAFHFVILGPFDVNASAPRFLESAIDVAHFAFIHEGYLGDPGFPLIPDYEVYREGGKIFTSTFPVYQPNAANGGSVDNLYFYEIHGPVMMSVTITNRETGNTIYIAGLVQPVEERKCRVYNLFAVDFDMPDEEIIPYQTLLFEQDKFVVEHQFPEELPLDLQAELHLRPDRLSIAYRKYLNELGVTLGTA
jgi:Phenylpropionate dioxygenase and related ring-hydroxylating dioxygenases, large terminal subunit